MYITLKPHTKLINSKTNKWVAHFIACSSSIITNHKNIFSSAVYNILNSLSYFLDEILISFDLISKASWAKQKVCLTLAEITKLSLFKSEICASYSSCCDSNFCANSYSLAAAAAEKLF